MNKWNGLLLFFLITTLTNCEFIPDDVLDAFGSTNSNCTSIDDTESDTERSIDRKQFGKISQPKREDCPNGLAKRSGVQIPQSLLDANVLDYFAWYFLQNTYNGKVKRVDFNKDSDSVNDRRFTEYDIDGEIINNLNFGGDYVEKYSYNDKNLYTQITTFDPFGSGGDLNLNLEYDAQDNIIERVDTNSSGKLVAKSFFEYNSNNYVLCSVYLDLFFDGGNPVGDCSDYSDMWYVYESNYTYSKTKNSSKILRYTINSSGLVIKGEFFDLDTNTLVGDYYYTYEYDSKGNPTKFTTVTIDTGDEFTLIQEYKYY